LGLLQGYVDVVVFQDVVERHGVGNVPALKALVRQLLSAPGGRFSVHRFHNDLRSQGIPVAKETLYALLSHLEDAFLVRVLSIHTGSERQRQSNPRKIYPVDPGLALAFERTGRPNTGALLETLVAIELERRGWETAYVSTDSGYEVDFLATRAGSRPLLVQVTADPTDASVRERECRALIEGAREQPTSRPLLLTGMSGPSVDGLPTLPIWRWLLAPED
jgi:predicted AAA+ superfamily ATPase